MKSEALVVRRVRRRVAFGWPLVPWCYGTSEESLSPPLQIHILQILTGMPVGEDLMVFAIAGPRTVYREPKACCRERQSRHFLHRRRVVRRCPRLFSIAIPLFRLKARDDRKNCHQPRRRCCRAQGVSEGFRQAGRSRALPLSEYQVLRVWHSRLGYREMFRRVWAVR